MNWIDANMFSGCPEWAEAINAMVDGELAPSEHHRVWQHLQTCPTCRQYYRQLQAVRKRMQRTHWASLWAKAIRENRRLRRWLVVGVLVAAFLSASVTFGLVRRLFVPPQMTPLAAIGIFRYHSQVPPEWTFNPCCVSGAACMVEKAKVKPVKLTLPQKPNAWERAGICECLGAPLAVYYTTVNQKPVMFLHFNTNLMPLKADEGTTVKWGEKRLRCYVLDEVHLLLWQEGQNGYALLVPFGELNPLQILPHIKLP